MEILPYTNAHHRFRQRLQTFLQQYVVPHVDQWEADLVLVAARDPLVSNP
jgi:hypothetical protein